MFGGSNRLSKSIFYYAIAAGIYGHKNPGWTAESPFRFRIGGSVCFISKLGARPYNIAAGAIGADAKPQNWSER
jgi:hypothetical protein